MSQENIQIKLDHLAAWRAFRESLQGRIESINEDAIPNEVQEEVAVLRGRILELEQPHREKAKDAVAEIEAEAATLSKNISALEDQIKAEVAEIGVSIKGAVLHAVYAKGRASWDDKALSG